MSARGVTSTLRGRSSRALCPAGWNLRVPLLVFAWGVIMFYNVLSRATRAFRVTYIVKR